MKLRPSLTRSIARFLALALLPASVAGITVVTAAASKSAAATAGCQLSGPVKHVIYLVFDNTHFTRDNPSVASDLEQMPHLLNFLTSNGSLLTNDHTVLISHTAGGILSSLTGLYPDRQGQTVSNSYFYFDPAGNPQFSTSFKYWTDRVDDANPDATSRDRLPNMVFDGKKTTPAPWVPFTRAGCDFGGVSTANIELENTGIGPYGDMSQAFGVGSPEWQDAKVSNGFPARTAAGAKALTDYVGIAIHCANGGGICTSNARNTANSRPDNLPDEPNGYAGYLALFGAKYVNRAITPDGNACVNDTSGQPVTDPFGQCGFPGFDGAYAKNTLGYVAQMQESGVPVTYAYISDAHDNHKDSFPAPFNPNFPRASGPGESDYKAQLKAYDDAFATFFDRLANDGITKDNTLFVVTADEGDHYAGGAGIPQADGSLAYAHANCSWTTTPACPSNQIGEVNLNIKKLLPVGTPSFSVHRDSAPAFWVNGQPDRTNATLRKLERDVAGLSAIDPYVSSSPTPVFLQLADTVGQKALHMINTDPARTPSFTAFGNPDYFVTDVGPSCGTNPCIDYHFAWSHGDTQPVIAETWLGLVGPGVKNLGIDSRTWTDHTNVRSTTLALAGLRDTYVHDGRVLVEAIESDALPHSLTAHRHTLLKLGDIYEQLNASFGQFGLDLLTASTSALKSTDETKYESIETSIVNLTAQRDSLAGQIKAALDAAAFDDQALDEHQAKEWIARARSLLDQAQQLAGGGQSGSGN
jgi:hypothetical protein